MSVNHFGLKNKPELSFSPSFLLSRSVRANVQVATHQLSEVLRSILHTIMFHRSLGMVSPLEVESKLFNLSYIECGDDYIQQVLEERIAEACKKVSRKGNWGGGTI